MPTDTESVLVFEVSQIDKLKTTITELQRQKAMQAKEYKEVKLIQAREYNTLYSHQCAEPS